MRGKKQHLQGSGLPPLLSTVVGRHPPLQVGRNNVDDYWLTLNWTHTYVLELEYIANHKDKTESQKILYLPRSSVPSLLMRIVGFPFIFGPPFSLRFKQSYIFHGSVDSKTIKTSDICSIFPLSVPSMNAANWVQCQRRLRDKKPIKIGLGLERDFLVVPNSSLPTIYPRNRSECCIFENQPK